MDAVTSDRSEAGQADLGRCRITEAELTSDHANIVKPIVHIRTGRHAGKSMNIDEVKLADAAYARISVQVSAQLISAHPHAEPDAHVAIPAGKPGPNTAGRTQNQIGFACIRRNAHGIAVRLID